MTDCLRLDHIQKAYGSLKILGDFNAEFTVPGIYCLTAPSGVGKTTLFRLIMGLEKPDSGFIYPLPSSLRFSAVFQEDRLIEHLSPVDNIALVMHGTIAKEDIHSEACCLLPEESLSRPVCTLSGGMKRRCAFLRAMIASSDVVILDEPFTGLDEDTKDAVIRYLINNQRNRLFLISTHDPEDIKKLGAVRVTLDNPQF